MRNGSKRNETLKKSGILALLVVTALGFWSCSRGDYSGKVETIRIGVPSLEQKALLYVAESQKLFSRNGLNIVIMTTPISQASGLSTGLHSHLTKHLL